jgi:hypothetical protein
MEWGGSSRTRAKNSAGVHDFPKKFGTAGEGKRFNTLQTSKCSGRTDPAENA